jgi:hypothetical protein
MNDQRPLKKPIDWDELYPGRFLKAGQLAIDKQHTLTIKGVVVERLDDSKGGEKVKGVITFHEVPYQLALNKTNGLCMKELFGRVLETWIGRKVTLFRGTVESGSRKGDPAVRVWGSPELERDRVVEITLPKKRPFKMTLHRVQARDVRRPEIERHPTEGQTPPDASSAGKDPDGGDRKPF